jgi:hypothetical protein
MSIKATRLTARVAPYRDAISKARKAGLTWADIGEALGVQNPDRLRWAFAHCGRYEADQIPLPEPKTAGLTTTTNKQQVGQSQPFDINSLPRIGGR